MRTLFLLFVVLFLSSCVHPRKGKTDLPVEPSARTEEASTTAKKESSALTSCATTIVASAGTIRREADLVSSKVPDPAKPAVSPHLNAIRSEATTVEGEAGKVAASANELMRMSEGLVRVTQEVNELAARSAALQTELVALQKSKDEQVAQLEKEKEQLQQDKISALNRAMVIMIIAGVVLIALSGTIFFSGNPKAIAGAIAGGLLIAGGMAVMVLTQYMWAFAAIFGLGVLVLLGVFIYHIVDYLNQKRGLRETIQTIERAKEVISPEAKRRVFGAGKDDSGIAGQIQSYSTEALVKQVRDELKAEEPK
jgi:uncharacterized membrane protein